MGESSGLVRILKDMAIFITGMKCSLCGLLMGDSAEVSGFPAFISNRRDPLYPFSDGAFHRRCLEAHPLANALQQRYEEWIAANRPPARICRITGELITDPDDYVGLGFLVESPAHELFPFNWAHFNRRALSGWLGRSELIAAVQRLSESGDWEGESLHYLLTDLTAPTSDSSSSTPRS